MKLLIEIPEEQYRLILQSDSTSIATHVSKECMMYTIKNGKPLDSVLDKIRAEITQRHLSINEKSEFDNGRTYAYEEVIDIIDKYKAESEESE